MDSFQDLSKIFYTHLTKFDTLIIPILSGIVKQIIPMITGIAMEFISKYNFSIGGIHYDQLQSFVGNHA